MGVMISSNAVNGIPCHINKHYITDILKGELGFKGVVISDFSDVEFLIEAHEVTMSKREATKMAVNAGLDMLMNPYDIDVVDYIVEMVENNEISMTRIDDAVSKILRLKLELDLFKNPVTDYRNYGNFASNNSKKLAYQSACESITLLKNKNSILPIKKGAKILVAGPNGNSMRTLNGAWTYNWQGKHTDLYVKGVPAYLINKVTKEGISKNSLISENLSPKNYTTIFESVSNVYGENNVTYVPGVSYKRGGAFYDMEEDDIDQVVKAAKSHDFILLCLGENSYTEKPGDLNDLNLHELQIKLANRLSKCGKPVILVLNIGRPRLKSQFCPCIYLKTIPSL